MSDWNTRAAVDIAVERISRETHLSRAEQERAIRAAVREIMARP